MSTWDPGPARNWGDSSRSGASEGLRNRAESPAGSWEGSPAPAAPPLGLAGFLGQEQHPCSELSSPADTTDPARGAPTLLSLRLPGTLRGSGGRFCGTQGGPRQLGLASPGRMVHTMTAAALCLPVPFTGYSCMFDLTNGSRMRVFEL